MEADILGLISKIEHGSTNDGAGFRSVVYFSGCPLNCQWCHNPELISYRPQLMYFQHKCVQCNQCLAVCPQVFSREDGRFTINATACTLCGHCTDICQGEALQLSARPYTPEEVFNEIAADKTFYAYSGGGVTFTGGECLMQHKFLKTLLQLCGEAKIHTCVESCLAVPFSVVEEVAPLVDHFFVDIKHTDPGKHLQFTGKSNKEILGNIQRLSTLGKAITFRLPLIPGVNDDTENLTRTVDFIHSLPGRNALELLRYNNLARNKYDSIEKVFHNFGKPQDVQKMQALADALDASYDDVCVFYRA